MQAKPPLVFALAVCLCSPPAFNHAQVASIPPSAAPISEPSKSVAQSHPETGRITGVLEDPSGAMVQGASLRIRCLASGLRRSATTDLEGRFIIDALPVGRYRITVTAKGFETATLPEIPVKAGGESAINMTLKVAPAISVVVVNGVALDASAATPLKVDSGERERSGNAAELLNASAGVSLRDNGQLASVPLLHGMGDERTKLIVDGMTVSSACANHMNPPLSYIAPSQVATVAVMAGITPVSMGGDSIGGTISVASAPPVFASHDERLHQEGSSTGFYRSNGLSRGGSLSEWIAGPNVAIGYNSFFAANDDHSDGSGHKVTSTYAQTTSQSVTLAAQTAANLFVLQAALHHTPYEGFPNAQMDLVRNLAESLNLHYRRELGAGALDARAFWQNAWHSMNIGKDKSTFPMAMSMPMNTHGRDIGYSVKLDFPIATRHSFRFGNELHRFVLDDRWPAVAGTAPMMGPDTFVSINNGHRTRLGTFGEVASKWNQQWTTLFGLRSDTVWSNAGPVQGYSAAIYGADADAFNAVDHAKSEIHVDATGMVRFEPGASSTYELGYARKTRSPNLYERYAWSTNLMASGMIGWFGDGNYYVGNLALKPETANTVSGTASWQNPLGKNWDLKVTPYLTSIDGYVDVDSFLTTMSGMSTFAQLRFANHDARIAGFDLSGSGAVWNSPRFGRGQVTGVAGWIHGERLDTSTGLYQMMPMNARLAFEEELKGLTVGLETQAVDRKTNVDPLRFEQPTPGYVLFNLRSAYQRRHLRFSAAAENLLNKSYELPLGGVNFDDFMAGMGMGQIKPLTGSGRSAFLAMTVEF
jgi:iron complex outermembrane receptor protein